MKICPDCHKVVAAIDAVELEGNYYHKSCRTCAKCGRVITGSKEFVNGKVYHSECLHEGNVCVVCGKPVDRYVRNYWGDVACVHHAQVCHYCDKFISEHTLGGKSVRYTVVRDGKTTSKDVPMCGMCERSVVRTPEEIEQCRKEIMDVFKKNDINGIPEDIPIRLSDMIEESDRMGFKLWGLNHSKISPSRERYSCEITIHENLPRLLFKGVLAHELLHSWLHLYAIELPDNEKEGFCNLGQYLVLHSEHQPVADYLCQWTLELDKDPIYGDGYRLMKKRLEKLRWSGLMKALRFNPKTLLT